MYTIRGADGSEHGSLTSRQVRDWIEQRRAVASTLARADDSPEWKPLATFVEFQLALETANAYAATPGAAPEDSRKTSSLALAAFCCSVFGFCGLTAIAGLVLGIISLVRIRKKPFQLSGERFAYSAIALSLIFLVALPVAFKSFGRYMSRTMYQSSRSSCHSHVRSLARAIRISSIANNGTYPSADSWCDAIKKEVVGLDQFRCPNDTNTTDCSYAYNVKVSNASNVDPQTIVVFESDLGWNGSGGPADMIKKARHGRQIVVGLASGSVRTITPGQTNGLRWDP